MDEQTIQQQEISSQEPEYQEQTEQQEPDYQESENDANDTDEAEPEVSVNDEGEVNFSDEFFGDIKEASGEPEPPSYYTETELQNIPYEQWDFNRMPEPVRQYMNALNAQTMVRQRQQQIQQRQIPQSMNEVKQYTAKELAEEGHKLAMEQLGITEDDWDEYEPEHQAALRIAENELLQKRNAEVQNYQRNIGEFNQLQNFNARLVAQPDFKEFDAWHTRRLQARNITQQQIDAGLMQLAQEHGYGAVQQVLSGWYQEFQSERPKNRDFQTRRSLRPPVLESTRGGYDSGRSMNMRNFGELDSDAQARALMDMGIV